MFANIQFDAFKKFAEPLKEMIINQTESYNNLQLQEIKASLRQQKNQHHEHLAAQVRDSSPATKQRVMDSLGKKSSSSWLTALPLKDHGFNPNRVLRDDALEVMFLRQFVCLSVCLSPGYLKKYYTDFYEQLWKCWP